MVVEFAVAFAAMITKKSLVPSLKGTIEREATTLGISRIAGYLQDHLGQKITAYLSGVGHAKTVGLWISGSAEPRDLPKVRLRYAYQAARLLVESYDDETAKAWFFGSNTLLDDEAPAYVLRHGTTPDDLRLVIPAARNLVEVAPPALAEAG
ncbi:MAG TPA: XRE family transcriptional regulator [Thermoanaerobaculia bacterium]|nr:XRE family transcriptional regulator [Thermoanaerobaculia bacterium]